MKSLLLAVVLALAARAADIVALEFDERSFRDLVATRPAPDFVELRTTGADPWIATRPFAAAAAIGKTVLTFEYLAIGAVPGFSVYVGQPWSEARVQAADELPHSEGWSTFSLDLAPAWERAGTPPDRLRLDFGRAPGHLIQVRNVRLRAPDEREREADAHRTARLADGRAHDAELRAYLARSFPAAVTRVAASADEIRIEGVVARAATDELFLAESPVWQHLTREAPLARVAALRPAADGSFGVNVRRLAESNGDSAPRDRLFSRWLVVRARPGGDEQLSAARYADAVEPRHAWPEKKARSKKGLGGFHAGRPEILGDLDALGIDSVTVNLFLGHYLRAAASATTVPFVRHGRTYHIERGQLERLDRTMLAAARRDALVFAIVLVPPASGWNGNLGAVLQHPDYHPAGTYSMANVTSAEGVAHTVALIDFFAERYSRPGAPHGRIHHWIVHNEVDAGWVWTNCGEKPPVLFMDQYHKAMRLVHLTARQYDPHARAYISLTHHWTETANPRFTPAREVLGHLLAFSRAEGDFDWGLAHHPYPASLREPKTWLDRRVDFTFETPLITFKNIEVLDAWVRQPAQLFLGRHVRSVHLTEQGPNSPDYSERALQEQAAAMAYLWPKLRRLDAIEGFQFHNWVDNRREGGLRIGLRRFPDDAEDPLGAKPIWHVYRALDTPDESRATAFALPLIGIRDWSEVPHLAPISPPPK
jgi:Family of unknown function (DUF5722)